MRTTRTWRVPPPWSTRPRLAHPTRRTRPCLHAAPGATTPGRAGPASGTGSRRAASAVVSAVTVTCARRARSGPAGRSGRPRSVPFSLGALQWATGAGGSRYPMAVRTAAFPPRTERPVCPLQFPAGSGMHGTGDCRPCAWFWKEGGCQNGEACRRCHLCSEGELLRRWRKRHIDRLSMRRRELQRGP